MCLNCLYNNFFLCSICNDKFCIENAYRQNRICDSCYRSGKVSFKSVCRKCKQIFPSRNRLFRHLEFANHFVKPLNDYTLIFSYFQHLQNMPQEHLRFNNEYHKYCKFGIRF